MAPWKCDWTVQAAYLHDINAKEKMEPANALETNCPASDNWLSSNPKGGAADDGRSKNKNSAPNSQTDWSEEDEFLFSIFIFANWQNMTYIEEQSNCQYFVWYFSHSWFSIDNFY